MAEMVTVEVQVPVGFQPLVVEVEDEFAAEAIEAIARNHGWTDQVPDPNDPEAMIDNPITMRRFAIKKSLENWVIPNIQKRRAIIAQRNPIPQGVTEDAN